jgi:hypothetical protein
VVERRVGDALVLLIILFFRFLDIIFRHGTVRKKGPQLKISDTVAFSCSRTSLLSRNSTYGITSYAEATFVRLFAAGVCVCFFNENKRALKPLHSSGQRKLEASVNR